MNKNKVKISLILNIIIVILTILASIVMYSGFKFMGESEIILESTKLSMFRFFTVLSNIFMGIIALIFAIKELNLLKGNINDINLKYYILKLLSTTSVALTFFVVFTYLGPIARGGILSLLKNSNLFFHLIIPLLSIINFIFFEKNNKIKFKYTFLGVIPTFLYEIYYLLNILFHMENGKVSPIYDWYYFVQNGVWIAIVVSLLMLVITYIICLLLYLFNKKKNTNNIN